MRQIEELVKALNHPKTLLEKKNYYSKCESVERIELNTAWSQFNWYSPPPAMVNRLDSNNIH